MSEQRLLCIGVGNEFRGDDAVGIMAARALREKSLPEIDVVELRGDGTALIEAWANTDTVFLIDAVCAGGEIGTIYRIDASANPLPAALRCSSTHTFSVGEVIELARTLNKLPPRVVVYGIEGSAFDIGADLSPQVKTAIEDVVQQVIREAQECTASEPLNE